MARYVKVAVVGSREGFDQERVQRFLCALGARHPDALLISGGAQGVDTWAEQGWMALGGQVRSYRPVKTAGGMQEDEYSIEVWSLGERPMVFIAPGPTFADFNSAATYRDMLIAEHADRGVAFRFNKSRGTTLTIGFFEVLDKPIHVYDEGEQHGTFQE